ncbi:MAG: hypothetical protein WC797_00055 [Candidatus Paceibacterota bacterium]|jgi:hypothetical protein
MEVSLTLALVLVALIPLVCILEEQGKHPILVFLFAAALSVAVFSLFGMAVVKIASGVSFVMGHASLIYLVPMS